MKIVNLMDLRDTASTKKLFFDFFFRKHFLPLTIKRSKQLFAFDVESRMGFTVSFTAFLMTIELGNLG